MKENKNLSTDIKDMMVDIYKKYFRIETSFDEMEKTNIPFVYNPEKHFILWIDKELSLQKAILELKRRFIVGKCDFVGFYEQQQEVKQSYFVVLRRNQEAIQEFDGRFSADQLKSRGFNGLINLQERLLLECLNKEEEGLPLDLKSKTLCAGSFDIYGNIPTVYRQSGQRSINIGLIKSSHFDGFSFPRIAIRT